MKREASLHQKTEREGGGWSSQLEKEWRKKTWYEGQTHSLSTG